MRENDLDNCGETTFRNQQLSTIMCTNVNKLGKINSLLIVGLWLSLSACYTSKIYVVRHAERLDQSADTPLSSAGLQRAQALADSLKNKNIDRIFGTKYQRNRQTAQVLCDVTGKGYEVYEPHPTEVIVKTVEKIGKQNVVIVGHSDTVLEIVKGFGVTPTKAKIESSDYDNLFVITVKKGVGGSRKTLEEKTYGAQTLP